MNIRCTTTRVLTSFALLLLLSCVAYGQQPEATAAPGTGPAATSAQIRLRLVDRTTLSADEAWESEQGIWYRVGGISYLIARERVKKIERGEASKPSVNDQVAKVVETNETQDELNNGPAWIYLVGGAKVEADSVTESAVGVWFRRGPLTIFIERSRIDHIEREDLETMAGADSSTRKERGWTTGSSRIDGLIRQNGAKYGVDPYLIFCVMEQESHFNSRALSPKGARGLMQLMPGTAARFGVRRPSDPAQNIAGGTRYLKQLIQQFDGRIDLVLASYNAGEGAVMKYGRRVPPYRETRNYVKRIGYRYRRTKPSAPVKQLPPSVAAAGM